MLSHTISRTVLATTLAALLLAPAASADGWARDRQVGLDPAIVIALHNRAEMTADRVAARDRQVGLDPAIVIALHNRAEMMADRVALDSAIVAAIHDRAAVTSRPVPLDPAIRFALREHESTLARPDDRAGARGVGSLPQPSPVATSSDFEWTNLGVGAGAMLAALLLALGYAIGLRHSRTRVTNA